MPLRLGIPACGSGHECGHRVGGRAFAAAKGAAQVIGQTVAGLAQVEGELGQWQQIDAGEWLRDLWWWRLWRSRHLVGRTGGHTTADALELRQHLVNRERFKHGSSFVAPARMSAVNEWASKVLDRAPRVQGCASQGG